MITQREKNELRGIFGKDIEIKDLKLGDLAYLKCRLDDKVRNGILSGAVDNLNDLVSFDTIRSALENGYNWREEITVPLDKMYIEGILYLDYLARLNEIHKDLSYNELRPIN